MGSAWANGSEFGSNASSRSGFGGSIAGTVERGLWIALAIGCVCGLAPSALLAAEPAIGLRAPACELTRLVAGAPSSPYLRAFEGRVTLVDFWASWCPTCEHAFGDLAALARDYREAGLLVVAVNLDANPRDALDFLAGRRLEFEVARDETGRCPRGFGLVGMPQAFLVDASGRIQAVMRGFRPGEARALRARIEELLVGEPGALPAVAAGPDRSQ